MYKMLFFSSSRALFCLYARVLRITGVSFQGRNSFTLVLPNFKQAVVFLRFLLMCFCFSVGSLILETRFNFQGTRKIIGSPHNSISHMYDILCFFSCDLERASYRYGFN